MAIELIGIACAAAFFSELSGLADKLKTALARVRIKRFRQPFARLRPFDCPLCLGYWLGLAYFLLVHRQGVYAVILCPFITSVLSALIVKTLRP